MIRIGILNLCLKELKKSNNPNYKIGAVIFKGSRIISSGFNKFRSSSIPLKYRKYEDSLHAEQSALLNADNWKLLKNSSILVIRLNKSGNLSMSFPCQYCYNSLEYVGIKWIYFSNRKGEILKEKLSDGFKFNRRYNINT